MAVRLVAPYTRTSDGFHALLLRSEGHCLTAFAVDGGDIPAASATVLRCTGDLLVPPGRSPEQVESQLVAKITAGKGVHELQNADGICLLLVPVRHVQPNAQGNLKWVPVTELTHSNLLATPLGVSSSLRAVLSSDSSQQLVAKLGRSAKLDPRPLTPPPPDASVPRKLDTDLFIGELSAVANEPLLRILGIRMIVAFADANGPAEEWSAAMAASKELEASLVTITADQEAASNDGRAALLRDCCDLLVHGIGEGGVLLAGPIDGSTAPGPAWVACAHLAASKAKVPVGKGFMRCRALYNGCRLSAGLAAEAQAFATAQHEAAAAAKDAKLAAKVKAKAARAAYLKKKGREPEPEESSEEDVDEDDASSEYKPTELERTAAQRAAALLKSGGNRIVRVRWSPDRPGGDGGAGYSASESATPTSQQLACMHALPTSSTDTSSSQGLTDQQRTAVEVRPCQEEGPAYPSMPRFAENITPMTSMPTPTPTRMPMPTVRASAAESAAPGRPLDKLPSRDTGATTSGPEATVVLPAPASGISTVLPPVPVTLPAAAVTWFKCKKCRAPLFTAAMLDIHEPGAGQAAFKPRKREARVVPDGCTSHFLLSDAIEGDAGSRLTSIEGKLGCPKCTTRIGNFDWSGMQCSCGTWVTPAVQVIKSKVDESAPPQQLRSLPPGIVPAMPRKASLASAAEPVGADTRTV